MSNIGDQIEAGVHQRPDDSSSGQFERPGWVPKPRLGAQTTQGAGNRGGISPWKWFGRDLARDCSESASDLARRIFALPPGVACPNHEIGNIAVLLANLAKGVLELSREPASTHDDAVQALPIGSQRIGPTGESEVYLGPMQNAAHIDCPRYNGKAIFALVRQVIRRHEEQTGKRPERITMPAEQRRMFGEWVNLEHWDRQGWDPLGEFRICGVPIEASEEGGK